MWKSLSPALCSALAMLQEAAPRCVALQDKTIQDSFFDNSGLGQACSPSPLIHYRHKSNHETIPNQDTPRIHVKITKFKDVAAGHHWSSHVWVPTLVFPAKTTWDT